MRRIDLMSKEEIINTLEYAEPQTNCKGCPCDGTENCTGDGCSCDIVNYLNEEIEVVPRITIYETAEDAFEDYYTRNRGVVYDYCKEELIGFAKFLMEKLPKPKIEKGE